MSLDLVLANPMGLHARAAAMFVRIANRFHSEIQVEKEGTRVNGKSILGLLTLAAGSGQRLTIRAWGFDASDAVGALALLIARGFDQRP
jgi:phosphocarrier protein HPr